LRMDFSITS